MIEHEKNESQFSNLYFANEALQNQSSFATNNWYLYVKLCLSKLKRLSRGNINRLTKIDKHSKFYIGKSL